MNNKQGSVVLMILLIMTGALFSVTAILKSAQLLKQSVYTYEQSACANAVVHEVMNYAVQVAKNNFEQLKKHSAQSTSLLTQSWDKWPGDKRYAAHAQLIPQGSEVKIIASVDKGAVHKKLGRVVALELKQPKDGVLAWKIQSFKV